MVGSHKSQGSIVKVAVAIIKNAANEILITKRSLDIPHGGMWEVPGGKFEPLETPYEALKREVLEEVSLEVQKAEFLGKIQHAYPEKIVCLHVFEVTKYQGEANINDGQLELKWIEPREFSNYEFPEANHKVMALLSAS